MDRKKPSLSTVMHILLVIAAAVLLMGQLSHSFPDSSARKLRFFGQWSRDGVSWHDYGEGKLSALEGDLYLRGNFAMQFPQNSSLSFYTFHTRVEIELNGQTLYTMPKAEGCGARWIRVQLPHIGSDDTFTLKLTNDHPIGNAHAYEATMDNLYYGDLQQIRETVEARDMTRRITGFTVMAMSIALMGMALVFGIMGQSHNARLLPIGLMALCYGGYLVFSSPTVYMGPHRTGLSTCALFISVIAALVELSILLRTCLTGGRKKTAGILLSVQMVWLTALLIWSAFGALSLCGLLDLWVPVQVGTLVLLLILGIWEWICVEKKHIGILTFCSLVLLVIMLEVLNEWLLLWGERLILDIVVALFFFVYAVYGMVSVPYNFRVAARAEKLQNDLNQNRIVLAMSQIRAHFIFNILNAISGMCKYDPEKADATLIRFARYLRGNIDVMQEDALESFSASLSHLQDYIALEQIRFGDKIRFRTETAVTAFSLPPLVLQPLVENAIKHGLTPKPEGGTITLTTEQIHDSIVISVADDGVGFPPEDMEKKSSVGLKNVRFRLRQLVDGEMSIDSTPEKGTTVTLTIPTCRVCKGKGAI